MAGTTYDKTTPTGQLEVLGGNVYPGLNSIRIKIDFSKTPVAAAGDNWKVLKLGNGWQLLDGKTRVPTASTSTATLDIGTAEDGTELDAAIDLSVQATGWTDMDTLVSGSPIEVTADGYIWFDFNTAAVSDGTLEVWLLIQVAPGEDDLYS